MTTRPAPPLHCKQCGSWLIRGNLWTRHCPQCGWSTWPRALRRVSIPQRATPHPLRLLDANHHGIWLSAPGQLWRFVPQKHNWCIYRYPAETLWLLNGLAALEQSVVLAPGEPQAVGPPKPLLALDVHQGQVLWQLDRQALEWFPPQADHRLVVAANSRGQVWAVHPNTGRPLWWYQTQPARWPWPDHGPLLTHQWVLIGDAEGHLHWLHRDTGKPQGTFGVPLERPPAVNPKGAWAVVPAQDGHLYRVDLPSGTARPLFHVPRRTSRGYFFGPPLLADPHLLIRHGQHPQGYALTLLDPDTGQMQWQYPLERHPYHAPALLGPWIFLPDRRGHLLVIELESGRELDRIPLPQPDPSQGEPTAEPLAGPVVQDQTAYWLGPGGELWVLSDYLTREDLPFPAQEAQPQGGLQWAALGFALQGQWEQVQHLLARHGVVQKDIPPPEPTALPPGSPLLHIQGSVSNTVIIIGAHNQVQQLLSSPPSPEEEHPHQESE